MTVRKKTRKPIQQSLLNKLSHLRPMSQIVNRQPHLMLLDCLSARRPSLLLRLNHPVYNQEIMPTDKDWNLLSTTSEQEIATATSPSQTSCENLKVSPSLPVKRKIPPSDHIVLRSTWFRLEQTLKMHLGDPKQVQTQCSKRIETTL